MFPVAAMTARGQVTRYEIRDASGLLVAVHCRSDRAGRKKRPWWERDGTPGLNGLPIADLPLYGIDRLGAESVVMLCEGAQAADALTAAGIQAVGTVTGAASCPGPAALAELGGRQVVLWPDNDEPGRAHMRRVAAGLAGIAASVRLVEWPEAPEHGDAADYLLPAKTAAELHELASAVAGGAEPYAPTGHTLEELRALLETAVPIEPIAAAQEAIGSGPDGAVTGTSARSLAEREQLIALCEGLDLFRDLDGRPYATIRIGGHPETVPLEARSRAFPAWLRHRFYERYQHSPGRNAVAEAVDQLEARALYEGDARTVYRRVAEADGCWYLDLGDHRVVEIRRDAWRILDGTAPVAFLRSPTAARLPVPVPGGSIEELRPFLHTGDDGSLWRLIVGWILSSLRPAGPYPILAIRGEHGAAKTAVAIVAKAFVDPSIDARPNQPSLVALPKKPEDFLVGIANRHVIAYDNVSFIPDWLSDDLARLAVGGSWPMRTLYTNLDETVVNACRPVVLNGIPDVVTRPDLADRTVGVALPVLPDDQKRSEVEFWSAFEVARPRILGALLDALVVGRQTAEAVHLGVGVRMVDAARFVVAAGASLGWERGAYERDIAEMRAGSSEALLSDSPLTAPLHALVDERSGPWEGSASELLVALEGKTDERTIRGPRWPKDGARLSKGLRRLTADLRRAGIEVLFDQRAGGARRGIIVRDCKSRQLTVPTAPTVPSRSERGDSTGDDATVTGRLPSRIGGEPAADSTDSTGQYDLRLLSPLSEHEDGPLDSTDGSLLPLASKREVERGPSPTAPVDHADAPAWLQARLEAGALDGHAPVALTTGETAKDVPLATRRLLSQAKGHGPVAAAARAQLVRLAAILKAEGMDL